MAMKKITLQQTVAVTLAVAAVATLMLIGNGVSQATTNHGDLLLEDGNTGGANTPTALGTIERQLCGVTADTVTIDVVAVDAEDWLAMSFLVYYPSPSVVTSPGPDDTGDNGPFDFIPADVVDEILVFDGPQNFLLPDDPSEVGGPDIQGLYNGTEETPDGSSPHGVSVFDGSIEFGNPSSGAGSGALARITLDVSDLEPGEYTLLLSNDAGFPGGLHSEEPPTAPPPFLPDNWGAFMLAIGTACPADDDGDGVSDDVENFFGSATDDADEIPESAAWIPEYNAPTCSDGIDNDKDGFTDSEDAGCPPAAPAPSDKTMDLDAGSLPSPLDIAAPLDTEWNELAPNFDQPWRVSDFTDDVDGDGFLSPGDIIEMFHMGDDGAVGGTGVNADGPPVFYLVDDLTITMFLIEVDGEGNDIADTESARELVGADADSAAMQAAIDDPLGTFWHEVAPDFSELWHLSGITPSGSLNADDLIDMTNTNDLSVTTAYRVDDLSLDILLTVIPDPDITADPLDGVAPLCGPGVGFLGPNEIPGEPPPLNDGSELICSYSSIISSAGADADDTCVVGVPCSITTAFIIERPPSTIQVPQPTSRAPLAPSVLVLTGGSFDFALDADVDDGDIVGQIVVRIGSDAGLTEECDTDLTLGPEFLRDGTIDKTTSTGAIGDLFNPNTWPLQLEIEQSLIEAIDPFGPALTLVARSVTVFDVGGTLENPGTPLNVLYWQFNPLVPGGLVAGEGPGGWVTASFTGDPVPLEAALIPELSFVEPSISDVTFCTPFSAVTTAFGTTSGVGGGGPPGPPGPDVLGPVQYRTCLTEGDPRVSVGTIEPHALNGTDADLGLRIDVGACVASTGVHDVRVVKINVPASAATLKPNEVVSKAVELIIQNQSPHDETDIRVRLKVTNPNPSKCTINGSTDAQIVLLDTVVSLTSGKKLTFSGPQTVIDIQCSDPVPTAVIAVKADVDHNDDDPFQLDNDDTDPADNSTTRFISVRPQ